MPKEDKTNKLITLALAVVICISAITVLYVSLPQDEKEEDKTSDVTSNGNHEDEDNEDEHEEPATVLTVIYGDEQTEYTLENLESLESYTGMGGQINKINKTSGPNEYTGVAIALLLEQITNIPENYSISVKSSDDWENLYSIDEIQGDIDIYNDSGVKNDTGNVTMIVAYKEDGEYITDPEEGPLRIAFVDNYFSSSSLWARMVVSIEIVEE